MFKDMILITPAFGYLRKLWAIKHVLDGSELEAFLMEVSWNPQTTN